MKKFLPILAILVMSLTLRYSHASAQGGAGLCRYIATDAYVESYVRAQGEAVTALQAPELMKIKRQVVLLPCDTPAGKDVEPDVEVSVPEPERGEVSPEAASWGLDKIRSPQANATGYRGQGAVACVIDTGLNDGAEFAGRVVGGKDFSGKGAWTDGHGHGTHVAGTVLATHYGVAPEARLLVAKVLGDNGSGSLSAVEAGIIWCADNGAHAENMSLGGSGESPSMVDAVAYARGKGVVVAAAAGNNGAREANYPGATAGVLGVISTEQSDAKSSFSNYGAWYDLSAPGSSICSVGGCWSGTSMATPHVTGIAALLAGNGITGAAAEQRIIATVVDLSAAGKDETFGYGRVDAYAAVMGGDGPQPTPNPAPTRTATRPAAWTATPKPAPSRTPSSGGDFVRETILLVNAHRADSGLPALVEDARLDAAAQGHSDDMAANGFLSHTGSDGGGPGERIARQEYDAVGWGETIGGGYVTPAQVVDAWMGSPPHRAILLGNLRDIGVGYAEGGPPYGTYWTADFATHSGAPPPPTRTPTQRPSPTRTLLPIVTLTHTPRPSATDTPQPIPTHTPTRTKTPIVTITPRPNTPTPTLPAPQPTPTRVAGQCGEVWIRGLNASQASIIQGQLKMAGLAAAWGQAPSGWYVRISPSVWVTCK